MTTETASEKLAMPIVRITEDGARANSRDVAAYFDKRHDHVLRAIDEIVAVHHLPNFGEMIVQTEIGKGGRRAFRTYDMDRDGFMLLAMGFTGKKALEWKLRYIEAFNRMEAELARLQAIDFAYGDRRDHPSTEGQLVWGQPASKINAAANMLSVVLRTWGPEAARELYRQEPTLPVLDGYEAGAVLEKPESDPVGCLKHLMAVSAEGQALGQLVDLARTDGVANAKLKRFGLDAQPRPQSPFLAVAIRHRFLAQAFAETVWIGEWAKALLQIPGAAIDKTMRQFGSDRSAAVVVPWTAFLPSE